MHRLSASPSEGICQSIRRRPEPPRYFMRCIQLNSISESARTGHLGCSAHPRSTQVVVQCEVTPFMRQIHPCLASYKTFAVVRQVIYLAVYRSCPFASFHRPRARNTSLKHPRDPYFSPREEPPSSLRPSFPKNDAWLTHWK